MVELLVENKEECKCLNVFNEYDMFPLAPLHLRGTIIVSIIVSKETEQHILP
jgi:hypothetical protein